MTGSNNWLTRRHRRWRRRRAGAAAAVMLLACLALAPAGCRAKTQPPAQLAPAAVELGSAAVEVPMPPRSNVPVLPVRLEGGATADMVVDTGASFVVVSHELVSRARLPVRPAGTLAGADPGGNVRRASATARVGRLCVDPPGGGQGVCFTAFDAFVTDLPDSSDDPVRIDGLLGLPLFRDVLLTLDYPRSRLRVERGDLPPPDGEEVLPMQIAAGGRALVPLRVGRREVWANIDTGLAAGLVVPDWAVAAFPGAERSVEGGDRFRFVAGVSPPSRAARLTEDVRLGRHVIRRPVVSVGVGDEPAIGTEYLSHFAVTLDQKNRRIRFDRLKMGAIEIPPLLRPGFQLDPASGVVEHVVPGGGAEGAGLRVGDRVTAVEGTPLAEFMRRGPRDAAAGRPDALSVEVQRGGRRLRFDVPPTVVVP